MADDTPLGPQDGQAAQSEPSPPDPPTQADKKTDLSELLSAAAGPSEGSEQEKKVVPPWEKSTEPAQQADDQDTFAERVRRAAKELAEAPPTETSADRDSPLLEIPAGPAAEASRSSAPVQPAAIESIMGDSSQAPASGQRSKRRRRKAERSPAQPAGDGPGETVADDNRMSGSRPQLGSTAGRRTPSIVMVEPGEPLAMPEADPQYLQKVQKDLISDEPSVIVRYGAMRQTGIFEHHLDIPPTVGTKVVIRSDRGVEIGRVVTKMCSGGCSSHGCTDSEQIVKYVATNGPKYHFRREGRVLRVANTQDLGDDRALAEKVREHMSFCRQQIADLKLNMHLVTVENLLGGERVVFYFSSEDRVDFRELVRRLTGKYHTRVELRQVGARDEARLVGDYERCGRQCCCRSFIKDLQPVSMRMAKLQKATLDPLKISGRCSRLMCCLRYEDECYKELRKNLPKKNTWVQTESLVGKIIDAQVLTQLVRVQKPDRSQTVIAVEEIIARDVEPPEMTGQSWGSGGAANRRGGRQSVSRQGDQAGQPKDSSPQGSQNGDDKSDRSSGEAQSGSKRRRSRKRRPADQPQMAQSGEMPDAKADVAGQSPAQEGTGQQDQGKSRRRKRRRKRKK